MGPVIARNCKFESSDFFSNHDSFTINAKLSYGFGKPWVKRKKLVTQLVSTRDSLHALMAQSK